MSSYERERRRAMAASRSPPWPAILNAGALSGVRGVAVGGVFSGVQALAASGGVPPAARARWVAATAARGGAQWGGFVGLYTVGDLGTRKLRGGGRDDVLNGAAGGGFAGGVMHALGGGMGALGGGGGAAGRAVGLGAALGGGLKLLNMMF